MATVPELSASVKTKLSMIDHRRDTNKFLLLKRNSFLSSVSKSISETGARIEWQLCLLEELFMTVLQMIRILESYSWNVCSCKAVDTGKLWTEWESVDSLYFAFKKKDQPRKIDRRLVSSVGRAPNYCAGGRGFEPQIGPTLMQGLKITEGRESAAFVFIYLQMVRRTCLLG